MILVLNLLFTVDATIGGIPTRGITEISGEAGCGKSQICLTLAMQVIRPLYIHDYISFADIIAV